MDAQLNGVCPAIPNLSQHDLSYHDTAHVVIQRLAESAWSDVVVAGDGRAAPEPLTTQDFEALARPLRYPPLPALQRGDRA